MSSKLVLLFLLLHLADRSGCETVDGGENGFRASNGWSRASSSPSPAASDWVERQHQHHVAAAIDSLLNMETISFDHREAGHLMPADLMISADSTQSQDYSDRPSNQSDLPTDRTPDMSDVMTRGGNPDAGAESVVDTLVVTVEPSMDSDATFANMVSESEASVVMINRTINQILSRPRSDDHNRMLKDVARNAILNKMRDYKMEAFSQAFTASKRGTPQKGMNLIGIVPGRYRDVPGKDQILLIGAHYDTVSSSAGIDDNASGMIVLLEIGRILMNNGQLNHTVMFVGFDLEELGLLGSIAFVREYLIPTELVNRKATFLGAYVIDMALNYDPFPGSQTLPRDIQATCPGITAKIAQDGNRGDFIAVWMRQGVDGDVYKPLASEWKGTSKYKLRAFDPKLPAATPSSAELYRFGTFTRSDHASFWYHKHANYKDTLNAVLLTDMGPWRGSTGSKCYHNWCDDASQLTERNLKFLKNTIDSLAGVVIRNPPAAPKSVTDDVSPQGSEVPTWSRRAPDRGVDRGSRTNRGRGPATRFSPQWPTFPSSFSSFPSFASSFPAAPSFARSLQRRQTLTPFSLI